jgi:biopolymer transport protein ExbD
MAFTTGSGGGPMADINVTPLVDVMLVLLIIFMITAPLMQHKVKVTLPKATLNEDKPLPMPPITLTIKADGSKYWNDEPVDQNNFEAKLGVDAQRVPQPQVNVRADATTKYGIIAAAVTAVKTHGFRKVGFVSSPDKH